MYVKSKNTALYFAFAYAIVVLSTAYYYYKPDKNADIILENMSINTLQKSDIAISADNDYTILTMAQTVKSNPKFEHLLFRMKEVQAIADRGRAILAVLESTNNHSLTQIQKDSALQTLKILYAVQEEVMDRDKTDWHNFKKKIFDVDSFKNIATNKTLYLQALRNALMTTEYIFLHYYAESFCSLVQYQPPYYAIESQLENTCVREGESVKGWFGFSNEMNIRRADTININGKPFPTIKGIATYRTQPQAAGKYPLVITSNLRLRDTLIRVRDTLYYTVR
jgi:hypothetical protein